MAEALRRGVDLCDVWICRDDALEDPDERRTLRQRQTRAGLEGLCRPSTQTVHRGADSVWWVLATRGCRSVVVVWLEGAQLTDFVGEFLLPMAAQPIQQTRQ